MKKLFSIFLLFFSIGANAQYLAPLDAKNSGARSVGILVTDSMQNMRFFDTATCKLAFPSKLAGRIARQSGRLYYNPTGTKFVLLDSFVAITSADTAAMLSPYLRSALAATTYVPYTGATSNVNLGTYNLIADAVQFNTTPSISASQGLTYWDAAEATLATTLDVTNGVTLQHGQEMYVRAVNKTGVTITDGQVVYISGAQGNRPKMTLAQADSISTSLVIGVATQNIADNAEGFVTTVGVVNGFNTSGFTAGDELFLSATSAGVLTNIPPSSPNNSAAVGIALNSTNNGSIYVHPQQTLSGDTTFADNSNRIGSTQKAVKAYVDKKLNIVDTANIRLRPIAGTNMTITGTYPNLTFNSSGGASGVTSVATTNGTGITGGTITTTGTLAIDTANIISTKLYRQKAVDSLNALIALKLNIANPTATGTLTTPALTISSLTAGSTSDSVVTVNAATGVLYRRAFPSSTSSGWSLTGNSVASVPLLGTTTNFNVDFIANNLRLGRLYSSTYSVAWGEGATATGFWGNAFGYGATASGQHGVSIGSYTEASDVGAIGIGYGAKAPNFASFNLSSNGGSGNYTTTFSRQGLLGADTEIDLQITPGVNILSVTANNVIANKPVTLKSYTVATLPSAAANTGAICYVTDASAPTYNATVTGGGAVLTIVFSNGTNWTCH